MKPKNLKTKIFLDSGDPDETKKIISLLGFLDGQTTNPTLISKNPRAAERFKRRDKFSQEEILDFYYKVVKKIANLIPDGSVSIEVYADSSTLAEQMFGQAKKMFTWIPNAHIKLPITKEGLKAAQMAIKEGIRLNMTLCFTQEQAAAVYAATKGASKGNVFVSPFVGRLDDRGEDGTELVANILKMYSQSDSHVQVLMASVRHLDHLLEAIHLGCDIVTCPFMVLKEWQEKGLPIPDKNFSYNIGHLLPIAYQEIDLRKPWQEFNIKHELTDTGLEKFSEDWNKLIG